MLKIDVQKGEAVKVIGSGTIPEIMSDFTSAVHALLENVDDSFAKTFKKLFITGIDSGIIIDCTPEEVKELRKEMKADILEDQMDNILDAVNELKKVKKQLEELKNASK